MMARPDIAAHVRQALAPLQRRVLLMLRRAIVRVVTDDAGIQLVQVDGLAGETVDRCERLQSYGFTSVPLPGAEAILSGAGGIRSHPLVLAIDDRRYRLRGLAGGEVAIYDDQGQTIVLHRDRIEVTAPKVVVVSADVRLGGEDGPMVARLGDEVTCPAGVGHISSASSVVRAA